MTAPELPPIVDLSVDVDSSLPTGSIVIRNQEGQSLATTIEQLRSIVQRAIDAIEILEDNKASELPHPKDAWEAFAQNRRLRDQNRLLGERFRQQEQIIRSAFARSVRGLSGDRPAAQRDASDVVRIVEDHYEAERLLKTAGVVASTVARGVRQLLDQRDRVVEVPVQSAAIVPVTFTVSQTFEGSGPDRIAESMMAKLFTSGATYCTRCTKYTGPAGGKCPDCGTQLIDEREP